MTCALCGFHFDEKQAGCRPSCPMSNGCNLVCCPNCGHGAVSDGPIAQRLRKLLVRLSLPGRSRLRRRRAEAAGRSTKWRSP